MAGSLSRLRLGSMVESLQESLQESLARVAARSGLVCRSTDVDADGAEVLKPQFVQ
jgi:hypothetical protein